jgi:nucleotide-binding universal stress UspA family protein
MTSYRRVLAAIELDQRGEAVARQGWALAEPQAARFALAHIVDYGRGFDSDHAPFLTPAEVEEKLTAIVGERLAALARRLGVPDAAILVGFGDKPAGLSKLALSWQPDLVIAGIQAPHGLVDGQPLEVQGTFSAAHCDVMLLPHVHPRPNPLRGWAARLTGALGG